MYKQVQNGRLQQRQPAMIKPSKADRAGMQLPTAALEKAC
jgi:hypothetical protein